MKTLSLVVIALLSLILATPVAAQEAAPAPLNVVDVRWSKSFQVAEYFQVNGRWIAPDVYFLRVPGYSEVGTGVGYTFLRGQEGSLALIAYLGAGSDGSRYFQPALSGQWQLGRVGGSLYLAYGQPLNSITPRRLIIDPLDVEYKLDDRWSVGASLTVIGIERDYTTKLGPIVRYRDGQGFWELRVARVNPGAEWEPQIRKVFEF